MVSKIFASVSVLVILMIVIVSGCVNQPIGGETDEHGCMLMAGYTWNDSLGFCLREWELNENQREAAGIVVAPYSFYVTVTGVDELKCKGCFVVHLQRNDNREMFTVSLHNWEIKYDINSFEECINAGYPAMESYPRQCMTPDGRSFTENIIIQNKDCNSDNDCVVFGETGDCNCGCFNEDSQWEAGGACFCAAPTSCKCVNGKCEEIFSDLEQACTDAGGTVATSLCCTSTNDFPNSCLIGPCGCAPDYSHDVKICDCGEGKCFDGSSCTEIQ